MNYVGSMLINLFVMGDWSKMTSSTYKSVKSPVKPIKATRGQHTSEERLHKVRTHNNGIPSSYTVLTAESPTKGNGVHHVKATRPTCLPISSPDKYQPKMNKYSPNPGSYSSRSSMGLTENVVVRPRKCTSSSRPVSYPCNPPLPSPKGRQSATKQMTSTNKVPCYSSKEMRKTTPTSKREICSNNIPSKYKTDSENYPIAERESSDLSDHSDIYIKEPGSSSLKKSKSTRKPVRHATYVSELDESVREKFRKKARDKDENRNKIPLKQQSDNYQVYSVSKRVVHCPRHSQYGKPNIKARCIEECPQFKKNSSSSSHNSHPVTPVVSKNNGRPSLSNIKPAKMGSNTRRNYGYKEDNMCVSPGYVVKTSNVKVSKEVSSKMKYDNHRARSAPAPSNRPGKPVQSYLVRNGLIPQKKSPEENIVVIKKKIRQKSFKLMRTRSKSFQHKYNAPTTKKTVVPGSKNDAKNMKIVNKTQNVRSSKNIDPSYLTNGNSKKAWNSKTKVKHEEPKINNVQRKGTFNKKKMDRKPSLRKTKQKKSEKVITDKNGRHSNGKVTNGNGTVEYELLDEDYVTDDEEEEDEECNGFEDFEDFGIDKEEVAEYYFNMFKQEFPEIVRETNLTKEELVSSNFISILRFLL